MFWKSTKSYGFGTTSEWVLMTEFTFLGEFTTFKCIKSPIFHTCFFSTHTIYTNKSINKKGYLSGGNMEKWSTLFIYIYSTTNIVTIINLYLTRQVTLIYNNSLALQSWLKMDEHWNINGQSRLLLLKISDRKYSHSNRK